MRIGMSDVLRSFLAPEVLAIVNELTGLFTLFGAFDDLGKNLDANEFGGFDQLIELFSRVDSIFDTSQCLLHHSSHSIRVQFVHWSFDNRALRLRHFHGMSKSEEMFAHGLKLLVNFDQILHRLIVVRRDALHGHDVLINILECERTFQGEQIILQSFSLVELHGQSVRNRVRVVTIEDLLKCGERRTDSGGNRCTFRR